MSIPRRVQYKLLFVLIGAIVNGFIKEREKKTTQGKCSLLSNSFASHFVAFTSSSTMKFRKGFALTFLALLSNDATRIFAQYVTTVTIYVNDNPFCTSVSSIGAPGGGAGSAGAAGGTSGSGASGGITSGSGASSGDAGGTGGTRSVPGSGISGTNGGGANGSGSVLRPNGGGGNSSATNGR